MSQILCIANQKSGVGKTTTAVNLAASLAIFEKRTLLVDCDPQGHSSQWLGVDATNADMNLYHAFVGKTDLADISTKTMLPFLTVLPANLDLFQAEHQLAVKPGKELILRRQLQKLKDRYDYIILDSPSSLGFFSICALAASGWVVVPFCDQAAAVGGFYQLMDIIHMINRELGADPKLAGLLINQGRHSQTDKDIISRDGFDRIKEKFFTTVIPHDQGFETAFASGQPMAFLDVASHGAESYLQFASEIIRFFND